MLSGILHPSSGEVRVAGSSPHSQRKQVAAKIGVVFGQRTQLWWDLPVRDSLELLAAMYKLPRGEYQRTLAEFGPVFEIKPLLEVPARKLSLGQRMRADLMAALLHRPPVLFLDEPTIGLDPQTRIRIWDYLRDINHQGTTIFLTTHYMDEADQLSDRISIIDHGKIVITGRSWELKNTLGQDLIYLETSDNWEAAELLKDLDSVKGIREKTKGIVVMVNVDGTYLLPEVMDRLRSRGIKIKAVNLKKPSMDDVFVHYTGRELRDSGAEKGAVVIPRSRGR